MKALQYILIFLMLTSCKGGLLENKSYNSIRTEFELKNHLVLYEDGFNYEITGDTSEKRIITSCHFVSKNLTGQMSRAIGITDGHCVKKNLLQ